MKKTGYLNNEDAPHRNKLLKNLKGERWKEIPGNEGYYLISNHGRVKSLPRHVEVFLPSRQMTISYYTKEKILTVKIREKWNTIVDKPYYECTVAIRLAGKETTYMISRLVYNAFITEIDFEKDRLMIMHKDGNNLNNYYKNLIAACRSDVTQTSYDRKRHVSPFAIKSKKEMKRIHKRAIISRQKPVIQFTLDFTEVKRFISIKEASLQTGIPGSNIVNMLKGNVKTAGGYRWQYDKKEI